MDNHDKENTDILPTIASSKPLHDDGTNTTGSKLKTLLRRLALVGIVIYLSSHVCDHWNVVAPSDAESRNACPQVDVLVPQKNGEVWNNISAILGTNDYKQKAISWLSGAVQVPTESYDAMDPVGKDPRWKVFDPFHKYLAKAFPLVHEKLKLKKVNTYGLIFEWTGSSPDLKPVLMAAHQDVVPVEKRTVDEWTHPPFSGYYDGERIWGRGSSDDKSGLIGILSSVETLISQGFQPTRTFVLAFGFDEEVSGPQGAGHIAPVLQETYGKNGFAFVIDEGSGYANVYGTTIASPGIAEKGAIDVLVEVATPGGHSSIPPVHTTIGILASILNHIEQNPPEVHIERSHPLYATYQCIAEHGPDVPSDFRRLIRASARSDRALRKLEGEFSKLRTERSMLSTTQAIDIIHGGVKANALPEQAYAVVNHRVSVTSSLAEVKSRDTELARSFAEKFNLTFTAFGQKMSDSDAPAVGTLTLSDAFHDGLEPAPVTPTGSDAAPYQLLSGTIKATFNAHRGLEGADNVIISPGMMTGNTDTRYYWSLSPHIFRYNHHNAGDRLNSLNGIHTVNEFIKADSFVEMIRFFVTLILNSDESRAL